MAALALAVSACQPAGPTPTASFATFTTVATAAGPTRVISSDVNHDGHLDVVVLSTTGNSVGVLMSNGAGGFAARVDYPAGPSPRAFSAMDLNHDDRPDIVVGDGNPVGVVVLMNAGDGTFAAPVTVSTPTLTGAPGGVELGNLDADSNPDLVFTNTSGNVVSVAKGNGDGTFATPVDHPTGALPQGVALGDVDHDGHLDIAVADQTAPLGLTGVPGFVSVLLGTGTGTFGAKTDYPVGDNPSSIAAADLNGDQKADLVIGDRGDGNVGTLLANAGGFAPVVENFAGSFIHGVSTTDLNGDGHPDVIASQAANQVSTLIANPDGSLQPMVAWNLWNVNTANQLGNEGLVGGDVTGDGHNDVTVVEQSTNKVAVIPGNGTGALRAVSNYGPGSKPDAVADFNGDGIPDVLGHTGSGASSGIAVSLGNARPGGLPNGTLAPTLIKTAIANLGGVAVNPLDGGALQGDTHADVVVAQTNGMVAVLRGNGDGTFQPPASFPTGTGASSVAVADVNGDSIPDIVSASSSFGSVSVLIGLADGSFATHVDYSAGIAPASLAVGDVTGDSEVDIVVANADSSANTVSVLPGTGTGTFGTRIPVPVGAEPLSLVLGHFHTGGPLDIATTNAVSNSTYTVSVIRSLGGATFSGATSYTVSQYSQGIVASDLNGDGRQDLFIGNGGLIVGQLLFGNGDGTFQQAVSGPGNFAGPSAVAADLNGDGHPDLVLSGSHGLAVDLATPA